MEGIKADDGEGWYFPDDVRFADGTRGAQAAWGQGLKYRRSMQRALDEVHPDTGVIFGRPGWTGQQAVGITWGGDQPSDFWSLRTLVAATLTAAATGFSNWSHDVGGYLGERLVARAPKELLARWVQFGCFTPLMHAHSRFEQEPWTYDDELLDLYRAHVLLHERLVPYIRAAAATAARTGLPIVRPLALTDPHRRARLVDRGRVRLRPFAVGRAGARGGRASVHVDLPRGDWIDLHTGAEHAGGGEVDADAPLRPDPGLGPARRADRHLSGRRTSPAAWGTRRSASARWRRRSGASPAGGRALARLADGTRIRYDRGEWTVTPDRPGELSTSRT